MRLLACFFSCFFQNLKLLHFYLINTYKYQNYRQVSLLQHICIQRQRKMSASVHKLPRMQDRWPNPVFFRLVFPRILIPVTPPDIFHLDVLDSITHIYIYIYAHTYEYLPYTLDLPRTMLDSSKSVRRTHDLRPKSRGVGRITAMMVIQGDYWNFAKSASI